MRHATDLPTSTPDLDLLTLEEVAQSLRVCKGTVYRFIKNKALPARKVGRQLRVHRADLERFLGAPDAG